MWRSIKEAVATENEAGVMLSVTMSMWLGSCEWRARIWLGGKLVMLAARVLVRGIADSSGKYEGESDD